MLFNLEFCDTKFTVPNYGKGIHIHLYNTGLGGGGGAKHGALSVSKRPKTVFGQVLHQI